MQTLNEITPSEQPRHCTRTIYSAAIAYEGRIVMNEAFATAHERRDAIVEHLRLNHDEVERAVVRQTIDRFGEASPDYATLAVFELYEQAVTGLLTLNLAENELDDGPSRLYGSLTDYGEGVISAEMQESSEDRLRALQDRVEMFFEDLTGNPLPQNADEAFLSGVMNTLFLNPTQGRFYLFEIQRNAEDTEWRSEIL